MTEMLIADIVKNAHEFLRIELNEFRGHQLISLRVYVKPDHANAPVPTPKGVTCAITMLPDILAALRKAEGEAQRQGILSGGNDA